MESSIIAEQGKTSQTILSRAGRDDFYGALYDYVAQEAEACNMKMILPREAFVLNTRQHPNCIDTSYFKGLDNGICVQAIYWSLLNHVPNQHAIAKWEAYSGKLSISRFQKKLFRVLSNSMESRLKRVWCVDKSFEGLNRIDCYQNLKSVTKLAARYKYLFIYCIEDKIVFYLYKIYQKTLRPIRIHFRDRLRKSTQLADK